MKLVLSTMMAVALAGCLCWIDSPSLAQSPSESPLQMGTALATSYSGNAAEPVQAGPPGGCRSCPDAACSDAGLYAGGDFLLIRPHFSEAIAYARGTQTPTTMDVEGRELQFDYQASFRAFVGYQRGDGAGAFQFTFSHYRGDISVDGSVSEPGEFLVDPFGNVVGAVAVIDPRDARFGSILFGGDLIQTKASVDANLFDFDFIKPFSLGSPSWVVTWSAGLRIADINQYYESVVTSQSELLSRGDFAVDFIGVGPRLGLDARRQFGHQGRFSLFANCHAGLLVGEYDVRFSNTVTTPVSFSVSQRDNLTRTIPVVETELGAAWQVNDSLHLSAGWLFQAWFDMGTSGGTFGGFFAGADDANIMSFDGLFLRAEWAF